MYEIIITKLDKNENYADERRLPYEPYTPQYEAELNMRFIKKKQLHTIITEQEFNAIKKGCLEIM